MVELTYNEQCPHAYQPRHFRDATGESALRLKAAEAPVRRPLGSVCGTEHAYVQLPP